MLRRAVLVLLVVMTATGVQAQLNRGSLTGIVTDSSGALIPNVKIEIRNADTGARYESVSNSAGQYTVPNLPRGAYQLTFEAPGMKTLVRSGISLGATEVVRVDAVMEVGAVSEQIQVTAEVPRLQTDRPEVGTSLENRELVDLPLSFSGSRNIEQFAYKMSPGVSGSYWTSHINGSSSFSKDVLLDGAPTTTYLAGDMSSSMMSVEAIQEFKIQSSGVSAEFGRSQPGIFNYVMKSGTNELHGSGFLAFRNEAFNANSFANKTFGRKRALDRKRSWALSGGGPIYLPKVYNGRNRTFFYVAYENYYTNELTYGSPNITEPLPEFYDGNFSRLLGAATGQTDALGNAVYRGAIYDPATFSQLPSGRWIGQMFPGNVVPKSRFSAVSQRLNAIAVKDYLPPVRDASGQIPLVNNAWQASGTPRYPYNPFTAKGDHNFSPRHHLSGSYTQIFQARWLFDGDSRLWSITQPYGGILSRLRYQTLTTFFDRLAEDWTISPSLLNHVTVFYNRYVNRNMPHPLPEYQVDGANILGIKNLSMPGMGFPAVNWGSGPFVTLNSVGAASSGSSTTAVSWGVIDTVSYSRGRHFFKFGFDHRRNHYNTRQSAFPTLNFNARATAIPNEAFSANLTGYSFASYLLGIVDSAGYTDPIGTGQRRHYWSLFVQDDFKVTSRLTLNLGLRWEYQPPGTEVANRYSSWDPNTPDPLSGLNGAYTFAGSCNICTGKDYFGTKHKLNLGPRFGFAWQPLQKWTIRGAYGIMFEGDHFSNFDISPIGKAGVVQAGGTFLLSADPVNPWKGIFNWDNGFPMDRYAPASYNRSWGNSNRPGMIDPNYGRTGYIQLWNLNIQRELTPHTVIDVGYVANKGTGLRVGDIALLNQLPASVLSQYGRNLNNTIRDAADAAANGVRYPYPGFVGTVAAALRPYPQVYGVTTVSRYGSPIGFSTFHSLQVTVNRQFSKGLTVYGNYVWSKGINNFSSSLLGDNSGSQPLDYYNLRREKSVSTYDVPHMFKNLIDYELPVGRGRRFGTDMPSAVNVILGGWSVSAILNYFSGTPLGFSGSFPLSGGWNGAVNRANIAAGDLKASGFAKSAFDLVNTGSPADTYLNKALFSDPAPLTLGTAARAYTQARGFGTINEDVGLLKRFTVKDRWRAQLRAELLNAFNRHNLSGINTSITSPLFGQVTGVSGNRVVQFSARFDF